MEMWGLHDDPKLIADQLGHTVDVNQNVYTKASVARRKVAVDALESALRHVMGSLDHFGAGLKASDANLLIFWSGRPGSNRRRPAWEAQYLLKIQEIAFLWS